MRWDAVGAGAVLALVAFAWTWLCGSRGFFPLDASVVLDGSCASSVARCLTGQSWIESAREGHRIEPFRILLRGFR